jgi:putative oxidoreductase
MRREQKPAVAAWARLFSSPLSPQAVDAGLLLVRITVGVAFIIHGWPKIQHPFSWADGLLAAPPILQFAAAIAEFVGGIALLVGLATRLFALLLFCDMLTAIALVQLPHGARFVAAHGGRSYELEAMYWTSAILLFLAGPGRYALDAYVSKADRNSGVLRR